MKKAVLISNSPGEIMTIMHPLYLELVKRGVEITAVIPPCQYSTGEEVGIVRSWKGVGRVVTPAEYMKFLFLMRNLGLSGDAAVFLGGDVFHALKISKKYRIPLYLYFEKARKLKQPVAGIFTVNGYVEGRQRSLSGDNRVMVSGDLMESSVRPLFGYDDTGAKGIAFFPGSRRYQFRYIFPFFLLVAELLKKAGVPGPFSFNKSPFVTDDMISRALSGSPGRALEGTRGTLSVRPGGNVAVTDGGTECLLIRGGFAGMLSDTRLAVTIPGSNTAQLGYLAKPFICVVPENKPEELPIDGALNYLDFIPFAGKMLKRRVVLAWGARIKYTALPNIRAGAFLAPEIRGVLTASAAAKGIMDIYGDRERLDGIRAALVKTRSGRKPEVYMSDIMEGKVRE